MKIPTTPPGNAPYYHGPPVNGMELNPPWQGNGIIVEGGSTNNGSYMIQQQAHHHGVPPAPSHHMVSNAGGAYMSQQQGGASVAYYPSSEPEDSPTPPHSQDFSEYMWMENQEEFDKQVMQQLEEEALMEQCIEAMLADEREAMGRTNDVNLEDQVSKSTLNPLAAEFVPSFIPAASNASGGDSVSPVDGVSNVESSAEPPTKALEDLTLSSEPSSPTSAEEKVVELNAITSNTESDIVVVSAKDVLTPKSSLDDSDKASPKSRDRKDSDKKKSDKKKGPSETSKKEKIVTAAVAAAVITSKSSPKTTAQRTRTLSGGDKGKSSAGDKKSTSGSNRKSSDKGELAASGAKKPEVKVVDDTVDLQGPPLPAISVPVVSALSSTPVTEPEKPSAPVVFNYAAAARANLPPKQPLPPPVQSLPGPPKEPVLTPNTRVTPAPTTNSVPAAKTQATSAPSKADPASKPKSGKSAEKGNGSTESKKTTAKAGGGGAAKKGGKK